MLAGDIIFLENFRHLAPKKISKFSVNSTKNAILFGKITKLKKKEKKYTANFLKNLIGLHM
jgi:hypothetical protein